MVATLPPPYFHQPTQHLRSISMRNLMTKMRTVMVITRIVVMAMTQLRKYNYQRNTNQTQSQYKVMKMTAIISESYLNRKKTQHENTMVATQPEPRNK